MPVIIAKSVAVGVLAFVLGVAAYFVAIALTAVLTITPGVDLDTPGHAMRYVLGAVTFSVWSLAVAVTVIAAVRGGAAALHLDFIRPLFVAALLTGVVAYFSLTISSEMNDCLWDVGFPLDRDCWAS